jgi:hypothetical protein
MRETARNWLRSRSKPPVWSMAAWRSWRNCGSNSPQPRGRRRPGRRGSERRGGGGGSEPGVRLNLFSWVQGMRLLAGSVNRKNVAQHRPSQWPSRLPEALCPSRLRIPPSFRTTCRPSPVGAETGESGGRDWLRRSPSLMGGRCQNLGELGVMIARGISKRPAGLMDRVSHRIRTATWVIPQSIINKTAISKMRKAKATQTIRPSLRTRQRPRPRTTSAMTPTT